MRLNQEQEIVTHSTVNYLNHANILTVSFKDELCHNDELVGGKGASLAKLSSMKTSQVFKFILKFFKYKQIYFLQFYTILVSCT